MLWTSNIFHKIKHIFTKAFFVSKGSSLHFLFLNDVMIPYHRSYQDWNISVFIEPFSLIVYVVPGITLILCHVDNSLLPDNTMICGFAILLRDTQDITAVHSLPQPDVVFEGRSPFSSTIFFLDGSDNNAVSLTLKIQSGLSVKKCWWCTSSNIS